MREFLDTAHDLWRLNKVGSAAQSFETVFEAISDLQPVHSKSQLDLDNIESVFTTCEMAKTLGRFPGQGNKDIDAVIRALKTLIVKTLELTVQFPCLGSNIQAPVPYGKFAQLLRQLRRFAKPSHSVTLITFNYDVALDQALWADGCVADYGFDQNLVGATDVVPLFKLHGSLNWTETLPTEQEKVVVPWPMAEYWQSHPIRRPQSDTAPCVVPIGSQLSELSGKYGKPVTGEAVLVPPTWNKAETHRSLSRVWKRAALALSGAENLFVVGFSMPETDSFFRYLYALGTVGRALLKRFWVFDIDKTDTVNRRFENLLGPGAKARFQYFAMTFENSIELLKGTFPPAS